MVTHEGKIPIKVCHRSKANKPDRLSVVGCMIRTRE